MAEILGSKGQRKVRRKKMKQKFGKCQNLRVQLS